MYTHGCVLVCRMTKQTTAPTETAAPIETPAPRAPHISGFVLHRAKVGETQYRIENKAWGSRGGKARRARPLRRSAGRGVRIPPALAANPLCYFDTQLPVWIARLEVLAGPGMAPTCQVRALGFLCWCQRQLAQLAALPAPAVQCQACARAQRRKA